MKKNVMMRVAAMLLVCVLASTCGISGTFAKYVTSGKGTDTARVAKFGVEVTAFDGMFSTTYVTHDTPMIGAVGANSVVSSDGVEKVVAPGTNGKMTEISISGTPEVAVEITYDVTSLVLTGWEYEGTYYCPIIITIAGNGYNHVIDGKDYTNATDFKNAIIAAIEGYTQAYAANTDLSGKQAHNLDISWSWPFENDEGAKYNQSDIKDTYLGDWELKGNTKPVITLSVDCYVTQVD